LIASIVYTIVGLRLDVGSAVAPERVTQVMTSIEGIFDFNILLVIPVIIVLAGSVMKKPTIPVMLLSSAVAIFNSVVFQGFTLQQGFTAAIDGFNLSMVNIPGFDPSTLIPDVARLLERGGMKSMLSTVLIAFCAYGFAGTLAVTGSLDIVLDRLTKVVKSTFGLVLATVISCLTAVFVTSNGQLSILLPGEMFSKTYIKKGLHPKNLSRTLEDSATVTEPIVPWTAAGVYMATTLGVPTLEYLPWAILCYTGVIFALIWAATGIGITKIKKGDEHYEEYISLNKADGVAVE
ncbi:MAG TPA: Na+/H+ antiporter NhaC family protein, partial [Defluviitaleaceae bacterium]|nr:Na+/H+ antiporter NhaC family protein [Defluviitaleaceae bacterium]